MSKVQIAAARLQVARKFAESNGLTPNQWVFIGSAMGLRGRKDGVLYLVGGVNEAVEDELSIWAHFRDGKVHRVEPEQRVKFDG